MATTNSKVAEVLLSELERAGIGFAFLHGEGATASGSAESDIDLVVDRSPKMILRRLAEHASLRLVLVWEYDRAGLTSFWTLEGESGGAQLDLLYDPRGRGKYALRTDVLLLRSILGVRWPKLSEADELLYLIVKRTVKGQHELLSQLNAEGRLDRNVLPSALTWRARWILKKAETGKISSRLNFVLILRSRVSQRGIRRIVHPAGIVVSLQGGAADSRRLANEIVARAGSFLVQSIRIDEPTRRRVEYLRRRPYLIVVRDGSRYRPDISVSNAKEGSYDEILSRISAFNVHRIRKRRVSWLVEN